MTAPADIPLRHGYTARDLHSITRIVIAADRWRTDTDLRDRYDAIHVAVVEHLLTAEDAPTRRELVNTGLAASDRHVQVEMRQHGYDLRNPGAGSGAGSGYSRYWQASGHTPAEERLVERLTVAKIWPTLTLTQQQAVMALALTDDHREAAASLGLPLTAFSARLKKARKRFEALWFEHETPGPRRMDKRVLARSGTWQGRRLLTDADLEVLRDRRADGATLRDLATEVGYSAGALCNLLRGKRRPAAAQKPARVAQQEDAAALKADRVRVRIPPRAPHHLSRSRTEAAA